MTTPLIEIIGLALLSFWIVFGFFDVRKSRRANLPRKLMMSRVYLVMRYAYVSLIVFALIVAAVRALAPSAHGAR